MMVLVVDRLTASKASRAAELQLEPICLAWQMPESKSETQNAESQRCKQPNNSDTQSCDQAKKSETQSYNIKTSLNHKRVVEEGWAELQPLLPEALAP